MTLLNENIESTLIAIVSTVRSKHTRLSYERLCELARVKRRNLDDSVPFVRRALVRENPNRVQCVQQVNKTIGPSSIYNCRGCPLLQGESCLANQTTHLVDSGDLRTPGGPKFVSVGKTSRRRTHS